MPRSWPKVEELYERPLGRAKQVAPISRLNLVHNWFAGLERLCPTRRQE